MVGKDKNNRKRKNKQTNKQKTKTNKQKYHLAVTILHFYQLRVRTVAKRHMRSSIFTASIILVSCVKLP